MCGQVGEHWKSTPRSLFCSDEFPWGFPPQGPSRGVQEDEDGEPTPLSPLPSSPLVFPSQAVLTSGFFSISGCGTTLSKPCTSQLSTR